MGDPLGVLGEVDVVRVSAARPIHRVAAASVAVVAVAVVLMVRMPKDGSFDALRLFAVAVRILDNEGARRVHMHRCARAGEVLVLHLSHVLLVRGADGSRAE